MIHSMKKKDARINSFGIYDRHKQMVRLHQKRYGPMKLVELTGLIWDSANTAINLYINNSRKPSGSNWTDRTQKSRSRPRSIGMTTHSLWTPDTHAQRKAGKVFNDCDCRRYQPRQMLLVDNQRGLSPDRLTELMELLVNCKLDTTTVEYMQLIERSSERIIKYFGDNHASHVANHDI